MNAENKTFTGQYIKYPNGNILSIYSQKTKRGIRHYSYCMGRFQIIGIDEINKFAHTL
jgi:hypothetical protein